MTNQMSGSGDRCAVLSSTVAAGHMRLLSSAVSVNYTQDSMKKRLCKICH